MSIQPRFETPAPQPLEEIWFTRCPVPTATGLAYKLGLFDRAFAPEGIAIRTLQDSSPELGLHHYDHRLPSLIREGGSMLAIAARAQREPTRLVGLTWIEESQVILARPDSGITRAEDLKGRRLALPAWARHPVPSHVRGCSIARGMSLHGYKGVLASAGLTFDDVEFVETGAETITNLAGTGRGGARTRAGLSSLWPLEALKSGLVDAIYVKGASALDAAREAGAVIAIDLDRLEPRFRVNNGTPRPITVHQSLIDDHFDHLARFLAETLKAADWAADHVTELREVLKSETLGSDEAVTRAYGDDFHRTLHPTLDEGRMELFEQQKKFLLTHGFLDADFDLSDWVDHRPLEAARELVAKGN